MRTRRVRFVYILAVIAVLGLLGGTITTSVTNYGRPDNTDFDPVMP
jgi:hypothetical protein